MNNDEDVRILFTGLAILGLTIARWPTGTVAKDAVRLADDAIEALRKKSYDTSS
jgi:hypothetical protein